VLRNIAMLYWCNSSDCTSPTACRTVPPPPHPLWGFCVSFMMSLTDGCQQRCAGRSPFVRLLYGIAYAITHILACFTHLTRLVRSVVQLVEILFEKTFIFSFFFKWRLLVTQRVQVVYLHVTYRNTHQRLVEVQFGRYQKYILQEWSMVKNLSCVSCAAWNVFPINSLVRGVQSYHLAW
jgi:hypothetical protein